MSEKVKSTKRALRRHYAQVKFVRACRKFVGLETEEDHGLKDWIRKNYNHLASCSCDMCGHKRKWQGKTIQEKRAEQKDE